MKLFKKVLKLLSFTNLAFLAIDSLISTNYSLKHSEILPGLSVSLLSHVKLIGRLVDDLLYELHC